jgi:replication factor C small subunit
MDGPLWTERHAPDLADLPQAEVRDRLARARTEPMNLVVHGPSGAGKTAAVRAFARETHDDPDNDLFELNVADFFDRTKKQIREDPRFAPFLAGRSRMAKRDMVNHVLKEVAGYAPVSGSYKTILLDNAEAIREDFQQALRRVMEQHHRTTQFMFTTRQPAKLIAPIQSRCFPVPIRAPTTDEMMAVLESICESESVEYDESGLEYVASAADGNLRTAVLTAQTTVAQTDELTMQTAYETLGDIGDDDAIHDILLAVSNGEFADAREMVDDLLTDEGYDGTTLLESLLRVARSQSTFDSDDVARLHKLAGAADHELTEGLDDRLHLLHLLTAWADGRTELRAMA